MACLYVVATPLGNLEDITPRAAAVLGRVEVVAAESVNRTRGLLSHLGLSGKRLLSCREANRARAAREVVEALTEGRDVALVSDAGTPGISDPGSFVVREAAAAGFTVSPVPGPSALAAALSVAGLDFAPVVFLGFPPAKSGARRRLLARAAATGWPLVLFEGPHRLADTAADLLAELGDRKVVVCRELTKLHEEVARTTLAALAQEAAGMETRGELTLVMEGGELPAADPEDVRELLLAGLREGREAPSALARRVAQATGEPREKVYRVLMELKEGRQERE